MHGDVGEKVDAALQPGEALDGGGEQPGGVVAGPVGGAGVEDRIGGPREREGPKQRIAEHVRARLHHHLDEQLQRRLGGVEKLGEGADQRGEPVCDGLRDQLFARAEDRVDGLAADPGPFGDGGNGHAVEAGIPDDATGGHEDALAGSHWVIISESRDGAGGTRRPVRHPA